ncbi:MAG: 50S ribosomal protein L13 [Candidatus Doudnabacteria bacterium RIFCSPHIGHO2_02_FULL_46_11]|uniref:Large ribosomal subunit protein uL13 n=1 Tax=Candidatus Doudnabacteria bacterium RIFCSPHIGHO2_02_FULL_46_11 TaxID=1817832 RepID=A0A1F5P803_9BACT|nr:MAG: 50S ribosomal protein L13 [Candidatus Doudnabacteria bacterium RIFCSPHIGHO2_02_FULL_46_11]
MKSQKTTLVKNNEIKREWYEFDASQFSLGRLATQVATILSGKHKATYAPHQDLGDYVVVTNAKKLKLTNPVRKSESKTYYRYSGYSGGLRKKTLGEIVAKNPADVIKRAVEGMLDSNRLRKLKMRRLKIVESDSHQFPVKK